jgi:methyl-accepting chemotaxis protein
MTGAGGIRGSQYPKYRRRHYFIKKGLQSRFIVGFSLAVLAGFLLNMAFAYRLIDRGLAEELYRVHIKIRSTSEIVLPILLRLAAFTVPVIFAAAAIVGYLLMRSIEMPLRRFREALRDAGRGDLSKGPPEGLPGDLPEAYVRMTGALSRDLNDLKASVNEMDERFGALSALLSKGARPAREELLGAARAMAESADKAGRTLSRFKL